MKNLKVRTKILSVFTFVIIVMAVLFSIIMVTFSNTTYTLMHHTASGKEMLLRASTDIMNMRRMTGMIHAFAGDEQRVISFQNDFNTSFAAANNFLDSYVEACRNKPYLTQEQLDGIIRSVAEMKDWLQQYKVLLFEPNVANAMIGDVEALMPTQAQYGWLIMSVSNGITELTDQIEEILTNVKTDIETTSNNVTIIFIVVLAVTMIIAVLLGIYVSGIISKPINRLVAVAENMANGNLNDNIDTSSNDETGMLSRSFVNMTGVINALVEEINNTGRRFIIEGDTDARVDSTRFNGSYRDVAESINNVKDGLVGSVLVFMECLSKLNNGDFTASIPMQPGKMAIMNNTLDNLKNSLKTINKDIMQLANSASDGNLSHRVEVKNYNGDWASLMSELNKLMEAISAPINEASTVMRHVSVGDFGSNMRGNYKGEFMLLKESINTTVTNIALYIDEISNVLVNLSQNDLNQEITRDYVGNFTNIKNALNNIIKTLNMMIGDIKTSSGQVAGNAKQIYESSMRLAQGATEQASSVMELNATVQAINESTSLNAENAKRAEILSDNSKSNAAKGDGDMRNMLVSMEGIKESFDKIARIARVIQDIAFQTNLLALNASIEAAHAGEQGKGFSVVADEVRNLANKSQDAAKEATALIEESNLRVNEGSQIAGKTADTLKTIVDDVSNIADIISNIVTSSQEQAEAVKNVSEGLEQITNVVQDNSASSEESASASQMLTNEADNMQNLISKFKMK